ncbi:MAG: NAD(P)H-hydrate dehydratase [Alphaproteobacteria bacterium]|nr:NAD(P)H-hydrate dehydratase [Alphaproteobacteria bacterium]
MMPRQNHPDLWCHEIPEPDEGSHKYTRGMAAIYAAPELTGATRLAAASAARMGAGLVNVLSEEHCANIYRTALPAHIIIRPLEWNDRRISARLYCPGGLPKGLSIRLNRPAVIDADGLLALAGHPEITKAQNRGDIVLTPHEGEFAKLFPDITGTRTEKTLAAARQTGACVVLKGAQSLIVHPDGRIVQNDNASPYLATAGSGDVLSGMITGLIAQGMPVFSAACAAVWMHGQCALRFGPGLVAEDLVALIPEVLKEVLGFSPELS